MLVTGLDAIRCHDTISVDYCTYDIMSSLPHQKETSDLTCVCAFGTGSLFNRDI